MNLLTRCQKKSGISCNAFNDLINVFNDHFGQNEIFNKFLRGPVNTVATNKSILEVIMEI